jgi:hypothetical protein
MLMFRRRQFRHHALHRPDEERLPLPDTQYCLRSAPRQDAKSARNNADSAIGSDGPSREERFRAQVLGLYRDERAKRRDAARKA